MDQIEQSETQKKIKFKSRIQFAAFIVSDLHLDLVPRRRVANVARINVEVSLRRRPVRRRHDLRRGLEANVEAESRPRRQAGRRARGPGNATRCGSEVS